MAVTIVRTNWIDDDGTGTTGTVINNAVKTALYNDIDGALAKVAQLTGGNSFSGSQAIFGTLTVAGFGPSYFQAAGTGGMTVTIRNTQAGTGNYSELAVGNDTDAALLSLWAFSSTWTAASDLVPNGANIRVTGAGGLSLTTTVAAPIKFWTNFIERMRIAATGEVLINTSSTLNPYQIVGIAADLGGKQCIVCQNTNASNSGTFQYYQNSAGTPCGAIAQTAATTIAFQTTSDQRLKTDLGRATDLTALRGVVIHDFAWMADDRHDRGVFAQEAAAVFPRAVSVGTDETTDAGALARPWMTDYSKFVPDLIVGWQQHDAELAELRALLATVKGSL